MKRPWIDILKKRAARRHSPTTNLQEKLEKVFTSPVSLDALKIVSSKLSKIAHAFIGGHAVSIQGTPRLTSDVDVLVNQADLDAVVDALDGRMIGGLSIGGKSVQIGGLTVDVVSPDIGWVRDAIQSADVTQYGKIVSKPYLVLTKLWAARGELDDADVLGLLRKMNEKEQKQTLGLVSKYLSEEDVDDLKQFIEITKM